MRKKGPESEWPPAARQAWAALDGRKVRPFSEVKRNLMANRFAMIETGRAKVPAAQPAEIRQRVEKWADVTTSRGLTWLTRHGEAARHAGGYLRRTRTASPADARLLEDVVGLEQRLAYLRRLLQNRRGQEPWLPQKVPVTSEIPALAVEDMHALRALLTRVVDELNRRLPRERNPGSTLSRETREA